MCYSLIITDIIDQFVQRRPLDLLELQVGQRIGQKIKNHPTLAHFADEQILALLLIGCVLKRLQPRKLFEWRDQ